MLKGVVSMPSNIFATTGTNVSVLFIDKENTDGNIVLMDASKLGTKVKEGKNQKTVLSKEEEDLIVDIFHKKESKEDLSVVVSYDEIKDKGYSFSAGQYFEIKIEYVEISKKEFEDRIKLFEENINNMFRDNDKLQREIQNNIKRLKYE